MGGCGGMNMWAAKSSPMPLSQSMRLTQARDTIRWAATHAENRSLGGDLNAWPDQTSIAEFNKTYSDSWTVAQQKGAATAP